jgi:hypothetical protein
VVNFAIRPLYLQEKPPYPLNRRLAGLQCQSGRSAEENPSPLPELEPRNVQPVTQSVYRLRYARPGWSVKIIVLVPKYHKSPARPHDMEAGTQVTQLALCYVKPYGRVQHCGSMSPTHPQFARPQSRDETLYILTQASLAGCNRGAVTPQYFFSCLRLFSLTTEFKGGLVKALRYESDGPGIKSRSCRWIFQ